MLYRGKWLTIDMDDYIPYNYDIPAFSYAVQNELWVMLLEKAWAKMYSSYKRIEAGFPEEALHDLTAAPVRHIFLQKPSFKP
jgi:calpain-15